MASAARSSPYTAPASASEPVKKAGKDKDIMAEHFRQQDQFDDIQARLQESAERFRQLEISGRVPDPHDTILPEAEEFMQCEAAKAEAIPADRPSQIIPAEIKSVNSRKPAHRPESSTSAAQAQLPYPRIDKEVPEKRRGKDDLSASGVSSTGHIVAAAPSTSTSDPQPCELAPKLRELSESLRRLKPLLTQQKQQQRD